MADEKPKRVGLIGSRLVRQVRPVPPDPGRAGRGRLALRRRQADAGRGGRAWSPRGRRRRRSRGPTATTARCSRRRTSTSCSIGTPDHWHALPMIAAVEAGADVYVQKPISVDVVEGQAMLAAARKHKRVVQVGTQRRSTPHLIEARDTIVKRGQARQDRPASRSTATTTCGPAATRPTAAPPDYLDYEMWTGPAPDAAVRRAGPPARVAGVHGIRQRHRRRHVHPHARHGPLDARPRLAEARSARPAASSCSKESKANIADTQTATFDYGDLQVVWQHRTWGDAARPEVSLGRDVLRRQGHAQGQRHQLRLHRRWARARRSTAT